MIDLPEQVVTLPLVDAPLPEQQQQQPQQQPEQQQQQQQGWGPPVEPLVLQAAESAGVCMCVQFCVPLRLCVHVFNM